MDSRRVTLSRTKAVLEGKLEKVAYNELLSSFDWFTKTTYFKPSQKILIINLGSFITSHLSHLLFVS